VGIYWWIIPIIILLAGLFYWYQIRPTLIYRECNGRALEQAVESHLEGKSELADIYETAYKLCLKEKGINR